MPASLNPLAYPASFAMLIEHFKSPDAGEIVQRHPRHTAAERLRFRFYNYKAALNHSPAHAEEARIAAGIIVKVRKDSEGAGAELRFSLRDNEDWALGLEAAIVQAQSAGGGGVQPPPTAGKRYEVKEETSHDTLIAGFMKSGGASGGAK